MRGSRLAGTFLGLAVLGSAEASLTYRMDGGTCVDSNRHELQMGADADGSPAYGVGPAVCSPAIAVELELDGGQLQRIAFSDGVAGFSMDIDGLFGEGYADLATGRGAVGASTTYGSFTFQARPDGSWWFIVDTTFGTDCYFGSTPGPFSEGGSCLLSGAYRSAGNFAGWLQVPEPGSAWLALLALLLCPIAEQPANSGTAAAKKKGPASLQGLDS